MISRVMILAVRAYQATIAPWLPQSCRFRPSCSAYMIEALRIHGPFRGALLGARRLLRCRPFGGEGYDPPQPKRAAAPKDAPPSDTRVSAPDDGGAVTSPRRT